jgi:ABC-2 type transport system permease protein
MGIPGILPYFPWAIPALFSGIVGRETLPHAGAISYFVLGLTCVLGIFGTAVWWRYSDQT